MPWKCDECGKCCSRFMIGIGQADVDRLKKFSYNPDDFVDERKDRSYIKKKNGRCFFLRDRFCEIHKKHGFRFKPCVCRSFPLNKARRNMVVCGDFAAPIKFESPAIDKNAKFSYKRKEIPANVLLHAIGKIQSANDWYSILVFIGKSSKKKVEKTDIDKALQNKIALSRLQKIRLKIILSGATYTFYPALVKILLKKSSTVLRFPIKNMKLCFNNIEKISIDAKEKNKFFKYLSAGNGIVYKPEFPDHLLFCLYFVDDFAKQLAYNKGRKTASLTDLLNVYAILNSKIKFGIKVS